MKLRFALLALACAPAHAETGYVFSGDLNGDGVPDSIASGPAEMFGNGGGPFVIRLSDGNGGFLLKEISLHPQAVALDTVEGHPRLWSYARLGCCSGVIVITTLDAALSTQTFALAFGQDSGAPSLSRDVYEAVFHGKFRITFETVDEYQVPPAPSGEWGK